MNKSWIWIGLAVAALLPGVGLILLAHKTFEDLEKNTPYLPAILLGITVIGAAFLLSWACEVAQLDIPQALALSVLALIAVLPEYSVDFTLTYKAGADPAYREFAVANMIGANRAIVGFAWPLVILLFCLKFRKKHVYLDKGQRVEIGFLMIAGLYSLTIPIKGHIDLFDCVVLVGLFVVYTFRISKAEAHEPELVGPPEMLSHFARTPRLIIVGVLLLVAGASIFVVAEPFAESLINTGTQIGVDETFMVQWFAPIASEAPEVVVCVIFTLRGLAAEGLGALVASKVNQWTLLVGTLPLVYLLGSNGKFNVLPLMGEIPEVDNPNQIHHYDLTGQMFVTSGQTLLAVMIILNLRAGYKGIAVLFGLFVAQFLSPKYIFDVDHNWIFGGIYLMLAAVLAFMGRKDFIPTFKGMFSPKFVREQLHPEEAHALENAQAKKSLSPN